MKPIVVTANDVYAGLKARAKEQSKRQAEQLAKYKEVKAKVIPERLFRNIAIERIIGKDYHNLKKRHQRILDALKPREKKYTELKELRKKEDDIQRIVDELAQQNKANQEEAKKIYDEVIKAKNKEKMYLAKAGELKENVPDSDRILYSRQLPRLVMRHSKLEGGKPLKDFQILSHNGRAYVVLSDIPTGKLEPQKKTALLLGDTVEKGQASVYTLTMGPNGKEILDVSRTKDTVRLYGSAKKTILKRGEGNHYPPHTEAVHQQRQTEVLGKINHFLEKAVEDTHGRYQAWWDDEDHRKKKDELERVEEEMYRGWSL
ncbi:mobA/MobL family protein [Megasphaera elsdenii CAG:570]|uniref:MobA/MobL family protein n=1 Tax=Megasphaera elsdenii CAG:570 TaxID=1263087 RepID=R7MWQ5_MEGEL|nr:mobA/MobL family protein [Megasphaera elsdenii CAG:570]